MADLPALEKEFVGETSRRINSQSLASRFDSKVISKGITSRDEVLPFLRIPNQVLPTPETPDREHHDSFWTFNHVRDSETLAYVSLEDNFSLPVSKDEEKRICNSLLDELRAVPNGAQKTDHLPPRLADLKGRMKSLDGWNLKTLYSLDTMDGWNTFQIYLEKSLGDTKVVVALDITYGCRFDVKIPLANFDKATKEAGQAVKLMSNWLGLRYPPNLEYEFSMNKGQIEDDPSRTSSTFPEYFFKTLDHWKSFPGSKELRALIGRSKDDLKPVLLLEDPSLSVQSSRINLAYILYEGRSSYSGLIVATHPDIFEAFTQAVRDRRVNQNLSELFPSENFDDRKWLHMFVRLDPEGGASLVEDRESNTGKEELRNLFDLIKKQYGISYGGMIDKSQAEREARRPMFMPKINTETAIIKEKYGSSTAEKFRGYAISALVDGSRHALEKYESYLKII